MVRPFSLSLASHRGTFHPSVGRELAERWLASPKALTPPEPIPPWRGASPDGTFFVKYREASRIQRFRHPLGDAFTRAVDLGVSLEANHIAAITPLALLRCPTPKGEARWLIMEFVEGQELGQAVATLKAEQRAQLFHRLALAVAKLHDAGFRQRDLKAPNILIRSDGEIVLVDLEGMRNIGAPLPERLRIKDLARLAASFQSDAFRRAGVADEEWQALLTTYCEGTGRTLLRPNWVAERVQHLAKTKVRKNAQKGRPLS